MPADWLGPAASMRSACLPGVLGDRSWNSVESVAPPLRQVHHPAWALPGLSMRTRTKSPAAGGLAGSAKVRVTPWPLAAAELARTVPVAPLFGPERSS